MKSEYPSRISTQAELLLNRMGEANRIDFFDCGGERLLAVITSAMAYLYVQRGMDDLVSVPINNLSETEVNKGIRVKAEIALRVRNTPEIK